LTVIDLPFDIPEYTLYLYWNRRYDSEPVHRWLRSIVLDTQQAAEIAFTRLRDGSVPQAVVMPGVDKRN
jgi:hypothetical protein